MINKELIQLNVSCKDKEEAIRLSLKPFLDNKYIEESYIEDVLKNLNSYGPYITIAPHIAMPHASTTSGVMKSGFGLTTLEEPVVFNCDHDPIKYLFPICATRNDGTLGTIAALSNIISEPDLYDILDHVTDVDEFVSICERIYVMN